jgi:hypothetical protein
MPFEHLGARVFPDMFSLAVAHKAFTPEGNIADAILAKRFGDNLVAFMNLVEAATHYPCIKKAWVEFLGEKNGKQKTIEYNLLDRYDPATKTSSMARTTGYTCTAAVNLIAKNIFNGKGVFPPELVGKHEDCFEFVMNYLKERNVNWKMSEL